MAHLTPDQFSTKWIPLLANNEFQNIDGPRLAQLITDIKDSFETAALVNVPDWLNGTYYPQDYLILHSFGGPGIFLKALQMGYLPVPSDPAGDVNWAPVLGPVVAGTYQVGTVLALQNSKGDWVPGRLYMLQHRVDAGGQALPDVLVRALSEGILEPEGYLLDLLARPPVPNRVRYELATDASAPVASYTDEQARSAALSSILTTATIRATYNVNTKLLEPSVRPASLGVEHLRADQLAATGVGAADLATLSDPAGWRNKRYVGPALAGPVAAGSLVANADYLFVFVTDNVPVRVPLA